MVAEALKWVVCTHDEYHGDSLWQPEVGFNYWGIPYSMIAPADRHQILLYLGYGKSMSEEGPDDVQVATLCLSPGGTIKSVIFPNDLESSRDPCKKGPACCIHWAMGALGAWGSYWSNIQPQVDSPSPGGVRWTGWLVLLWVWMICYPWRLRTGWFALLWTRWFALLWDRMIRSLVDRMIRSLVGHDDSLSCGQDD